jgi:arsenate reductase (thioredoxin)
MILSKVLLVCTGNSCRSQMAHGFLSSFSNKISIYSAGTRPEAVNRHTVEVMRKIGVDITENISNDVTDYLNEEFDFIIFLCKNAKKISPALKSLNPLILKQFLDPANAKGTEKEIIEVYKGVRDEIELFMQDFFKNNLNK